MCVMWKSIGKWALKVATYAVGHQAVITQTVADAKAKNIPAMIEDAKAIVAGVKGA
jgi:hypothetical protein